MTSPIEAMAKAIWHSEYAEEYQPLPDDWVLCLSQARAALLALAECEIPDSILKMGMARYYEGPENDEAAAFGGGVQAILRALIEESK